MYVWGRNNNHLFKQNHKKTYSLPQKIPVNYPIVKCAAGYDYTLILSENPNPLICYYQSAFYKIHNFTDLVDIATTDNMIVIVASNGSAWIMQFNPQKFVSGELNPTKISLKQQVIRVYMNYSDIFLLTKGQSVYHLKRNEWYETKTYTDPTLVSGLDVKTIVNIAPGGSHNYFLNQKGQIYLSDKGNPTKARLAKIKVKFTSISASQYFVGVTENGRLYIWGEYNGQNIEEPAEFGKISQQFKEVQISGENGFAITVEGQAWVWGKNANGQLGLSDYQPRLKAFPLITLQKEKIKHIFIGESYTVCTVEPSKSRQKQITFKRQAYKVNVDPDQTENLPKKKVMKQTSNSNKKLPCILEHLPDEILVDEYSSLKLKKQQKFTKTPLQKIKSISTEVVRQSQAKKSKTTDKSPRKSNEKATHRSISPLSQKSRSHSKSPLPKSSKSPYLEHGRHNSQSAIKKRKEFSQRNNADISHNRNNTAIEMQCPNAHRQNSSCKQRHSKQRILQSKVKELQEQNELLKQILTIKQNVIEDITKKIKLLQEAIQEHQRTLTSRDNLVEDYQKREKQYQIHIDQLEKHIEDLIKGKSAVLLQQKAKIKEGSNDLSKERDFFIAKIAEYETLLKEERQQFHQKIKQLEEQIYTYRSQNNKENLEEDLKHYPDQSFSSKAQKPSKSSLNPLEQKQIKMNFIISRIQDSKIRIAQSTTKLYEMMDQN